MAEEFFRTIGAFGNAMLVIPRLVGTGPGTFYSVMGQQGLMALGKKKK